VCTQTAFNWALNPDQQLNPQPLPLGPFMQGACRLTRSVLVDNVTRLHHKALHHAREGHPHIAQVAPTNINPLAEGQEVVHSLWGAARVEQQDPQGKGGGALTSQTRQMEQWL